jgi:AraC-like DNA-binding protein
VREQAGAGQDGGVAGDWSRYWRCADAPLEAMHAHFERHVYHRHSHDTYSLGVTDSGAQTFTCRGASWTSGAGMVMTFNPDDPHDGGAADGWTGDGLGFTYRMTHIGPGLVAAILADLTAEDRHPARPGLPLFTQPVVTDPGLARRLRAVHRALLGGAPALRRDELLAAAVGTAVRRATRTGLPAAAPGPPRAATAAVARQARDLLADRYLDDLSAADLSAATGRSRFTVHRAFQAAYGMAPSDYQRQLRLRAARRLIATGAPVSDVAARTGFADQSHLSRWFTRYYGVTPGRYQRAARPA